MFKYQVIQPVTSQGAGASACTWVTTSNPIPTTVAVFSFNATSSSNTGPSVTFTARLPLSINTFQQQEPFYISAIAATAGVNSNYVTVVSVTAISGNRRTAYMPDSEKNRRRLLVSDGSVDVLTSVAVPAGTSASSIVSGLSLNAIDSNLQHFNLPAATFTKAPIATTLVVVGPPSTPSASEVARTQSWLLIISGGVLLILVHLGSN